MNAIAKLSLQEHIASQDQKLEALKTYKEGMMLQFFPSQDFD